MELSQQVLPYINSPASTAQAVNELQGADGILSFASIEDSLGDSTLCPGPCAGEATIKMLRAGVGGAIQQAMRLGIHGENWRAIPGIRAANIVSGPQASSLFTFHTLKRLTSDLVFNREAAAKLDDLLTTAESASGQGDRTKALAALNSYIEIVEAGTFAKPQHLDRATTQTCGGCHLLSDEVSISDPDSRGLAGAARIMLPR